MNATKTLDEQDPKNPFKPFPDREYFTVLHKLWIREPIVFVEKSRTMMASWWGAAECLHYVMTHQPSKAIFWAQDEDRAIKLIEYAWTLYNEQDSLLKLEFPLNKPRDQQKYDRLVLASGGVCMAIPGKGPDKIRSEHPTIVMMDEACFIEQGAEAFDVALASKVLKVLVISSAAPSWFRNLTKDAVPEAYV